MRFDGQPILISGAGRGRGPMSRTVDSVLRARHVHPLPGQLPLWPLEDEPDTTTPEEPTDSNTNEPERNEQ